MNIEHVEKSYQELESDSTLQNLIAQANARYIIRKNLKKIFLDIQLKMSS